MESSPQPELFLRTNLTMQAAKEFVEKMTKNGYAVVEIADAGTIGFGFPAFLLQMDSK
jgi:hypothetical protein